jgi:hypothetical protein
MEGKKNIKNIVLGLLCLLILVLIGYSLYQHLQFNKLSSNNIQETVANKQTTGAPETEATVTASEDISVAGPKKERTDNVNDLKAQLDATEQEIEKANAKLAEEATKKAELKKKEIALQKQSIGSPAMRSSYRSYLETQYADIFKEMNLSPEDLEKFKDLLTDYQMSRSNISIDASIASTDAEKAAIKKRMDDAYKAYESASKELMGDAAYQIFYDYKERANARGDVTGFKEVLGADEKLTGDQEKALVEILYKEQTNIYSEIGYDPNKTIEFSSDTKAGRITGQLKNMEKIHTNAVESAKGTLSASQLERLSSYLKSRREQVEMYLKLSDE